jgi:CIC family chloride channel protein
VGALIGLVTGLGAVGFDWALHRVEHWSMHQQGAMQERWGLWLLPAIPAAGGLITGLLVFLFARDAEGHGVPQVLDALIRRSGLIRARVGVVKAIASVATVGSGGSAGAEGPIIQIGSTAGSVLARSLGVPREHVGTMVGCGAAAGISAIFNAPITGVFFALEILLRDFSLKTFTPIVIASVFATGITQVLLGKSDAIFATSLPEYVFTLSELPSYAVLGGLCALAAVALTHALHWTEDVFDRVRLHAVLKPALGGLLLGVLGIAYLWVLRRSGAEGVVTAVGGEHVPSFFGNGYAAIRSLLDPNAYTLSFATDQAVGLIVLLAVLVAAKTVATSLTLGSRGSGGTFAPSLFVGACAGGLFGAVMQAAGLIPPGGSPASYALVGMAAVVAGATFAPLTAILLLFEITREPLVLAPIMLAAITSTGVARQLMPDSIYTHRLRRAGLLIGGGRDLTLLRRVPLARVDRTALPKEAIYASDPLSKLVTLHAEHNVPDFPVVDQDGKYMGMVTGADIRTALIDREAIPLLLVAELLRTDLPVLGPEEALDTVLDKFAKHDVASLCLVHEKTGAPTALITRSRVMAAYQRALEQDD